MSRRYPGGFLTVAYNGFKVPNAPTIGTATNGNTQAAVTFTAPVNVGGGPITGYQAIATDAITGARVLATGSSSPITVTGLTNYVTYNIAVAAINVYGAGPASGTVAANPYLPNPPTSVEYLVVAGGGGGGLNGGGGAGGVRTGSVSVPSGQALGVTVGSGGGGGSAVNFGGKTGVVYYDAAAGGSSTFYNITATGGGKGGRYFSTSSSTLISIMGGGNGGSGGGAGGYGLFVNQYGQFQVVNQGGTGISGQGFAGGDATNAGGGNRFLYGGGGGGASAVGTVSPSSTVPGSGGNGVASSITGSSITYGGGGGGGVGSSSTFIDLPQANRGLGGSGGGGSGGYYTPGFNVGKTFFPAQYYGGDSGTQNLGGGGGAGLQRNAITNFSRAGGTGGSGVIVIRYPDSFDPPVAVTGSPTVTVSGGYRIYRWTGSGSITF